MVGTLVTVIVVATLANGSCVVNVLNVFYCIVVVTVESLMM